MKDKGFRILAITDAAPISTGYGNQADKVLSRLVDRGWDVYQLGCNCFGLDNALRRESDGYYHYHGIKIVENKHTWEGGDYLYGTKETIRELYDDLRPDVIWTLNDISHVINLTELSDEIRDRWVHWLPLDNNKRPGEWSWAYEKMKHLIFLSSFGFESESKYVPIDVEVDAIYHAVSIEEFYPMDKNACKRRHGMNDRFVVATVGRHQPRKMIYQSARAMADIMKRHNDVVWVCKTDPYDHAMRDEPLEESDLVEIMKEAGVLDRTIFEPEMLTTEQMNDLYNTADVFLHISGGEGFGIPYVESMLSGTPCILTDNTTSPELTNRWDFGLPVRVLGQRYIESFDVTYDVPDVHEAIDKLEFAYNDWKKGSVWLSMAGRKARAFHAIWCNAERVVDQWERYLCAMIHNRNSHI